MPWEISRYELAWTGNLHGLEALSTRPSVSKSVLRIRGRPADRIRSTADIAMITIGQSIPLLQ
jgi:hypothetical protein